ncbi:hypothetical protein E8E15_002501 [Penicillium rubens]|uniref:Uncharacterized protein n=1 Tax=Penicillium chrysogenum TaxID=5076 RepID=A0ABQ8WE63_PENCH|nr:hypothetical protein E8E15_002501 [Penicillium rubens]KAJ5264931.1 hypothetical protein N7505_007724 [Penicillium chrysogenum]
MSSQLHKFAAGDSKTLTVIVTSFTPRKASHKIFDDSQPTFPIPCNILHNFIGDLYFFCSPADQKLHDRDSTPLIGGGFLDNTISDLHFIPFSILEQFHDGRLVAGRSFFQDIIGVLDS